MLREKDDLIFLLRKEINKFMSEMMNKKNKAYMVLENSCDSIVDLV